MSKICCCHALSAGAAVGILQLIVVSMQMAGSGIVLNRYETWEDYEESEWERRPTPSPSTVDPALNVTGLNTIPSHWTESWLELQLAEHIGFCAVWMVSLVIYALAFRYYMPVMVLPNIFVLVIALIITLVVAGSILIRLLDVDSYFQTDDYEEAFLVFVCASLFFWFFVIIGFLIVTIQFYNYVKKVDQRDERGLASSRRDDRY